MSDDFEPHNSLKFSFTNVGDLRANFVESESFLESNSSEITALCETNLDDSVDSGDFSVKGYLRLFRKDSVTNMHGLAGYVKEAFPFARILTYVLDWLYFTQCLTSFFSTDHCLRHYTRFLILFHLTQMRFFRSYHLLMYLHLETLTFITRTG